MRRTFMLPGVLLLLSTAVPHLLAAQQCAAPRTALVLSGGGAKGLVHIGVLRALDSLGIRPDLIVGSSMGAVVGAMYASGYSARTIDSMARVFPIATLFRTFEPRAPRALGRLQPLLVWEQRDRGFNLQNAAVREPEANALLNATMLRGNLIARGNFDRLPIPLRVVATDLGTRQPVVLSGGDLAQAVRASIAIPFIFAPERIDGRFLADGGLSANLPIAIARAAGAERVIVVDARERQPDSLNFYSPLTLAQRMLGYLFEQPLDSLAAGDAYIRPNVAGFHSLDFAPWKMTSLILRGRLAADSVLARMQCPPTGTVPHFPAPRVLAGVSISSPGSGRASGLTRLLGLAGTDSLDPERLRTRLLQLGSSDRFVSLWLHPAGQGDSVTLHLAPERAPRRVAAIGAAYDNDIGGRFWAGLVNRSPVGGIEASLLGSVGNLRKDLTVGVQQQRAVLGQLLVPRMSFRVGFDHIRQFDANGEQVGTERTREAEVLVGIEQELIRSWTVGLNESTLWWRNPDQATQRAFGARVSVSHTNRNLDQDVTVQALWNQEFRSVVLDAAPLFVVAHLEINPHVRIGAGEDLPLQYALELGGSEGFAGLHIGELRGDREALASLALAYPLLGPLRVRVDGMVGRIATGGPLLDRSGWHTGVRGGVGADTPVGPVRVELGVTKGRELLFVRLGRWF